MSLDRQEYPAVLATLEPAQAVEVLNERVRLVGQVNTSVAEWLQERRRIEEQYSSALRRLSRKPSVLGPAELGIFATPWSALLANLDNLADAHSNLAAKIESDLERPLREYATTNREVKQMPNMQGNLSSIAKDIEGASKKVEKAGTKGGVPQKLATANTELESARSQWESQAPFVFESLQALDEARVNYLRDILTQLQTHEVDKVERSRVAAEQCLNVLLTLDTADEIKMFALRMSSDERPRTSQRRPQALQPSASFASLPPSTPGPGAEDRRSQRSDSLSELPTPKSDKPRGLRRLGTVLSRRRESKIPAGAGRISESPERTSNSTPDKRASRLPASASFANFGRSMRSRDNTLETPREEQAERPRSPLRTMSGINDTSDPDAITEAPRLAADPTDRAVNSTNHNDIAGLQIGESQARPAELHAPNEMERTNETPERPGNVASAIDAAFGADGITEQQRSQAYKVDIQDASGENDGNHDLLTSMANTLKMQGPSGSSTRRQGTARGRRDNRASVYDSLSTAGTPGLDLKRPIAEEPGSPAQPEPQALSGKSTAPSLAANASSTVATVSDTSETRDVEQAAPQSTYLSQILPAPITNLANSVSSVFGNGPQTPVSAIRPTSAAKDDNASIRSGRSQSSIASVSHRHLEAREPGLNTSIIDTISATFDGGKMSKVTILGEIAMTNNADATSSSEIIRLRHLSSTDKIAPNPAFISNDAASNGTYTVNLAQLGKSKQQVAFKYQISGTSSTAGSFAPLVVHPQWKIEAKQTSVIVSYSLNPSFEAETVTLKDASLLLHLGEGSKTSSCLSKPAGTLNKERGVLCWSMDEMVLKKGDAPTKMLARFMTETEAKVGRVEARWTIEGAGSGVAIEVKGVKQDDPFSDAEASESWTEIQGEAARRRLTAGQYIAT